MRVLRNKTAGILFEVTGKPVNFVLSEVSPILNSSGPIRSEKTNVVSVVGSYFHHFASLWLIQVLWTLCLRSNGNHKFRFLTILHLIAYISFLIVELFNNPCSLILLGLNRPCWFYFMMFIPFSLLQFLTNVCYSRHYHQMWNV